MSNLQYPLPNRLLILITVDETNLTSSSTPLTILLRYLLSERQCPWVGVHLQVKHPTSTTNTAEQQVISQDHRTVCTNRTVVPMIEMGF